VELSRSSGWGSDNGTDNGTIAYGRGSWTISLTGYVEPTRAPEDIFLGDTDPRSEPTLEGAAPITMLSVEPVTAGAAT
jgi:hypothetical protein